MDERSSDPEHCDDTTVPQVGDVVSEVGVIATFIEDTIREVGQQEPGPTENNIPVIKHTTDVQGIQGSIISSSMPSPRLGDDGAVKRQHVDHVDALTPSNAPTHERIEVVDEESALHIEHRVPSSRDEEPVGPAEAAPGAAMLFGDASRVEESDYEEEPVTLPTDAAQPSSLPPHPTAVARTSGIERRDDEDDADDDCEEEEDDEHLMRNSAADEAGGPSCAACGAALHRPTAYCPVCGERQAAVADATPAFGAWDSVAAIAFNTIGTAEAAAAARPGDDHCGLCGRPLVAPPDGITVGLCPECRTAVEVGQAAVASERPLRGTVRRLTDALAESDRRVVALRARCAVLQQSSADALEEHALAVSELARERARETAAIAARDAAIARRYAASEAADTATAALRRGVRPRLSRGPHVPADDAAGWYDAVIRVVDTACAAAASGGTAHPLVCWCDGATS